MHSRVETVPAIAACVLLLLSAASSASALSETGYRIVGAEAGSWPKLFSAVGFVPGGGDSPIIVVRPGANAAEINWQGVLESGAVVVLEGESEAARSLGFRSTSKQVRVGSLVDVHAPKLPIIWAKALELPVFEVPAAAQVFAKERWEGAPLTAGYRRGKGAVLWVAVSPGDNGYERFPYVLHALASLGLEAPFRSRRLWAFFDYSYRMRVDLDYFAARWRKAGIAALHVAAWHFYDPDAERDAYLNRLIQACHRKGILVYAWIELPHVSEKFWQDHPEWREKTALQQDAHLDWRKLMNLINRDCFRSVSQGIRRLTERFDWDGVNLAELYFESLEGYLNPARFTPMNADVRAEFRKLNGFDPLELYNESSPHFHKKTADGMRAFLEYRAGLAKRLQEEWIGVIEEVRAGRHNLDLVLTHVDDRFETQMRDLIGADAARLLPLLDRHDFTFLIEDPATIWHLGPERYPEIARRYQPLTRRQDKLAIDINIVERYQDVYPTKQQTGVELYQLVNLAARSFTRVALYFENSILTQDLPLLPSAAAVVSRVERREEKTVIDSPYGVGVPWNGPARVNGKPWPVAGDGVVWLPPGPCVLERATQSPPLHLIDFNGDLRTATATGSGIDFTYTSPARAFAVLDRKPSKIELDGEAAAVEASPVAGGWLLTLPRGQHLVSVSAEKPAEAVGGR